MQWIKTTVTTCLMESLDAPKCDKVASYDLHHPRLNRDGSPVLMTPSSVPQPDDSPEEQGKPAEYVPDGDEGVHETKDAKKEAWPGSGTSPRDVPGGTATSFHLGASLAPHLKKASQTRPVPYVLLTVCTEFQTFFLIVKHGYGFSAASCEVIGWSGWMNVYQWVSETLNGWIGGKLLGAAAATSHVTADGSMSAGSAMASSSAGTVRGSAPDLPKLCDEVKAGLTTRLTPKVG